MRRNNPSELEGIDNVARECQYVTMSDCAGSPCPFVNVCVYVGILAMFSIPAAGVWIVTNGSFQLRQGARGSPWPFPSLSPFILQAMLGRKENAAKPRCQASARHCVSQHGRMWEESWSAFREEGGNLRERAKSENGGKNSSNQEDVRRKTDPRKEI